MPANAVPEPIHFSGERGEPPDRLQYWAGREARRWCRDIICAVAGTRRRPAVERVFVPEPKRTPPLAILATAGAAS